MLRTIYRRRLKCRNPIIIPMAPRRVKVRYGAVQNVTLAIIAPFRMEPTSNEGRGVLSP